MTQPLDIFVVPPATARIQALDRRLRTLERVSWGGRQRFGVETSTRTRITTDTYGLNPLFPHVPVYVPEGAWVSITAQVSVEVSSQSTAFFSEIWGAIFEITDAADEFYTGEQVFNYYANTPNSSTMNTNPTTLTGQTVDRQPLMYRPQVWGEKVYTIDFRREIGNRTDPTAPTDPNLDWVDVVSGWLTVEVR